MCLRGGGLHHAARPCLGRSFFFHYFAVATSILPHMFGGGDEHPAAFVFSPEHHLTHSVTESSATAMLLGKSNKAEQRMLPCSSALVAKAFFLHAVSCCNGFAIMHVEG